MEVYDSQQDKQRNSQYGIFLEESHSLEGEIVSIVIRGLKDNAAVKIPWVLWQSLLLPWASKVIVILYFTGDFQWVSYKIQSC